MFKQAYVRGVTNALIQSGHVAFPDEDTATKVADYIAESLDFDPGTITREGAFKIANYAIEASRHIASQGYKAASVALKVASIDDLNKLAHAHVLHLMEKAAEGSTIEGGDKGNTEPTTGEGKMDASQRPAGYAENSLGTSAVDTRPGAVGQEQPQPNAPSESPSGSNSLTDASKSAASLEALIKKVAEGTTIQGGDKGNTEPTTAEGKMDASQRPAGYAVLPSPGDLGELMNQVSGSAVVGRETPHPNGPAQSPSGSNSLTETSGKAAAAEDPFITVFKKTAAEVAKYLPASLNEEAKVAHVRACMGMTNVERAHYLVGLQKEAADKTAPKGNQRKIAEMPAFLQEKKDEGEKKDENKDKKDEEKKDDSGSGFSFAKKDDENKEASLADHLRRITASINAG